MKLTTGNTKGKNVQVYDCTGSRIPACKSFNTKTYEAVIYLVGKSFGNKNRILMSKKNAKKGLYPSGTVNLKTVTVKVTLKGAYAKINGKIVK